MTNMYGANYEIHDYDPANGNDRAELRQQLLATGSVLASVGHCGDDNLPCGVCEECVTQGQDCEICEAGVPSRSWPMAGSLGDYSACKDCMDHVSLGDLH